MIEALLSILAAILEKISLGWWQRRKKTEANNDANNVQGMSDSSVSDELRDKWTQR